MKNRAGYLMVALSAVGYGCVTTFVKIALGYGLNVITIGSVRFILASVFLWIVLIALKILKGMKKIGPSSAAIVSNLEPVATVILGIAAFSEVLSGFQFFGAFLVVAGIFLLQYGRCDLDRQGSDDFHST